MSFDDFQIQRMQAAINEEKKEKMFFCFGSGLGTMDIKSRCDLIMAKTGSLDLVVIDYLQILKLSSENRIDALSKAIRQIKELAISKQTVVICLSQLNRKSREDTGKIEFYHLMGSSEIEAAADMVWFLDRPIKSAKQRDIESGKINPKAAVLSIAKNRYGMTKDISLEFHAEHTLFSDPSKNHSSPAPDKDGFFKVNLPE
jgi:replicative DNA helicase